ncbi:hypothetical protein CYLTODRAFT_343161 [Cylindrobasidium torrendii FP15055 ss-10]|uniref:DUF1275 domain protein n=1 Tax=Cylindrobasidium torrendii FP15055 ss-10 TaxID=1314674 RepID=A0A0D7BRV0_9AGAR|nr:hypothetical protein CYLTODRAFT_343161 [Cylindrobasidium torrendii FP15055 ss-10]
MSQAKAQAQSSEYPSNSENRPTSIRTFLMQDVDPEGCIGPLSAYCFMTGYIDVLSFSAIFVWCGFQTGNLAQLGLAIARLFDGSHGHRDSIFHLPDRQALTSLLTFNAGAFVGRIGDYIGAKTRLWLVLGTFIQTVFTMVAAVTMFKSGQGSVADDRAIPVWSNALSYVCLAFMSASLGLQGVLGKRLNTQFTTTIVLTTVWIELMTDPKLFDFKHMVKTRDHKLIAASALLFGAFVGRAILAAIGTPGALGVACGFRVLITLSWLVVPAKK